MTRIKADCNVKWLALTSFLNDVASEATLRLLPLYLSHVLGAGPAIIGLIESIADSTATFTKLLSGWLSDRLPRRKPLVVAGYALSGLTKPFLIFATHWGMILFIRFADRLGKGIRTAPRDALIASTTHESKRGYSFGLVRAMDMLGGFVGLGLAYLFVQGGGVLLTRETYHSIVWLATIPAVLTVVTVAVFVREARRTRAKNAIKGDFKRLPKRFWSYIAVVSLFTLSNSSDAFLVLRASRAHAGVGFVLVCLAAMSLVSALIAVPAGHLSDRYGRKRMIVAGWIVFALTYAGFAALGPRSSALTVLGLFVFYGAFSGLSEGAEKSLVADLVGEENRGLAYGIFGVAVGVMTFPASLAFGLVMQYYGEPVAFSISAGLAAVAALGLGLVRL